MLDRIGLVLCLQLDMILDMIFQLPFDFIQRIHIGQYVKYFNETKLFFLTYCRLLMKIGEISPWITTERISHIYIIIFDIIIYNCMEN